MELRELFLKEIQEYSLQLNNESLQKLLKYAQKLKELEQSRKE